MRKRYCPIFLLPGSSEPFPDPRGADADGLVAVGGDLGPERLLAAYRCGVFPWFDEGMPILWWSPSPRAIMELDRAHVSRSLRRRWQSGAFSVTLNRAFTRVMLACGDRNEGTWITSEMVAAYGRLHDLGVAHSVEVWRGDALVGGLYGVQVGTAFAAESMFHRATDASKVALVVSVRSLARAGFTLFDVQFLTPHLKSMGASEISRESYLERVSLAASGSADLTESALDFF